MRPSVLPDHLYPDIWLTGIAIEELLAMPADRPWFLWVSFPGPHEPFDVPSSWREKKLNGPIPDALPRPTDAKEIRRLAPSGSELNRKLLRWPEGIPNDALANLRADYADHLSLLDHQIGRLLFLLGQRSDSKRTAVTICSDHGELLGDWGLLLKGCFLEGAIRSLFLHRTPFGRRNLSSRLSAYRRPFGLTQLLWAAARHVMDSEQESFGEILNSIPKPVLIEFGEERKVL